MKYSNIGNAIKDINEVHQYGLRGDCYLYLTFVESMNNMSIPPESEFEMIMHAAFEKLTGVSIESTGYFHLEEYSHGGMSSGMITPEAWKEKIIPLWKSVIYHGAKTRHPLMPVIQEEPTGCGIASVANILGNTYAQMKDIANAMGIYAEDTLLWSDTQFVRRMLATEHVETSSNEIPFESWEGLPDLALLSIKHHQKEGENFWHWVVFRRLNGKSFVLDSSSYLKSNIRTDFDEIHPKWFIQVTNA